MVKNLCLPPASCEVPNREFAEAAEVLEMINQTPEQLEQDRARMKFHMDEVAKLDYVRQEGEEKGLQKGELIGQITTLQSVLEISTPSRDELLTFDLARLTEFAKQFQEQLRSRSH